MPSPISESGPFNLLRPLLLLFYSAIYLIPTITSLLLSHNFSVLLSPSRLQTAWFARFWSFFGPRSRDNAAASVVPLLQHSARGVCLDLGPGNGQWVHLFARAVKGATMPITRIYGVEPNAGMHAELRRNVVAAGLSDVYEILGCGAAELGSRAGLKPGSIDTIITVQVLCSIDGAEAVIGELYPLLKPGGKWLVFEHVRTKYQGEFVAYWQSEFTCLAKTWGGGGGGSDADD